MSSAKWKLNEACCAPYRAQRITNLSAWAKANVILPGSARSERFDSAITPWLREPLERLLEDEVRTITFVKPVQSGGSVLGEVALCHWLANETGDIQYNWEDDEKAADRWSKRVVRIIEGCKAIARPADRFKSQKCLLTFPRGNLTMQGVHTESNLDSDSIKYQINEEIHNWEPGRLHKAYNRTTAFWNSKILNISNAGKMKDQLHQAWEHGTQQYWEVKCPGCGLYHRMRTRWDERKPELGGLRYDSEGCKLDGGRYNYAKLAPTVRYQMPCGYEVRDTETERRQLSLSGKFSDATNPGAPLSDRSYTYEAVSVDYISWLKLIQEKHRALFARQHGDPELWLRYITERECLFYDPDDVPILGAVTLSAGVRKNRTGLPNRIGRLAALDRQQGSLAKGEAPHWWGVIVDVDPEGNALLVWEGKFLTDEDAVQTLREHEVLPHCVVVDSGDDTVHVYRFCMANGFHALKGSSESFFRHPGGTRRIFSDFTNQPLHAMISAPAKFDYVSSDGKLYPDQREPKFIWYSKTGIRDRFTWWREAKRFDIPEDVSDDFRSHMESEERQTYPHPTTGELMTRYVQLKTRNDLYVCMCYIALMVDISGLVGAPEPTSQENKTL